MAGPAQPGQGRPEPSGELTLTLNGERRTVPAPLTVAGLLEHLGLQASQVAVERNRRLVRRAEFPATVLAPGDELEVVTFFGGG